MIRTQVYLTLDLVRQISLLAKQEGKSMAEIIRELLALALQRRQQANPSQGLLKLAELGKQWNTQAPADLSTNLDEYLYGNKE
jgi:metal-responsive CopG/Arc/MetJ family transcriptional regulator